MNIDKAFKLEEVAESSKGTREVIKSIYVYQNGRAWAVSTNGKALAKVPVTLEEGELKRGNSIKGHDFKFQRSNPALKKLDTMYCDIQPLDGEYPNFDMLFPKDKGQVSFGIDVSLLASLGKALGTDNVKIEYFGEGKALKVSSTTTEAHGLIMPIKTE